MIPCFRHDRDFEAKRLVYKVGFETDVKVETPEVKHEKKEDLPDVEFDPKHTTREQAWGPIEAKYGIEKTGKDSFEGAYKEMIDAYVSRLMPSTANAEYRAALLRGSYGRYMQFYEHIKLRFMAKGSLEGESTEFDYIQARFDWAEYHVKEKTRNELGILRRAIEGSSESMSFAETMPNPEADRDGVEKYFDNYLDALNGRYFNKHVNEGTVIPGAGIPILDPFIFADKKVFQHEAHPGERVKVPIIGPVVGSDVWKAVNYNARSDSFQRKMQKWVDAKLDYLFDTGADQKAFQEFQKEIGERYALYAGIDSDRAIISSADLEVLKQAARPAQDTFKRMMESGDEHIIRRLEVMHLMEHDDWEDVVKLAKNSIVNQAVRNGMKPEFIAKVNAELKARGQEPVPKDDFKKAKNAFEDMLDEVSPVGVRETLDFIRKFNMGMYGEIIKFEEQVEPEALRPLVDRQINYLLGGVLVPQRPLDQQLVRFMASNSEERRNMLKGEASRETLFRAIRMATEMYPDMYDKQFRVPDDPSKLRTSRRIRKPTAHDQAAQLQALIVLGKQADYIVRKLSRNPEHDGNNFVEEMEKATMPDEPKAVKLGLKFKPPGKKNLQYVSAIHRGGFNTRDLALKGAKIFGAFTVLANVAHEFNAARHDSDDFIDAIFATAEGIATNHAAIGGAAVTVGAHMAERNPKFLKYPWLSQHERAEVMTVFKLDNLEARLGSDIVKGFLHNNAEWRAMAHPKMDPDQIRELTKAAAKRTARGEKPKITIADMKEVIKDQSIITTLSRGGQSARMRYLFYTKFLAGRVKPDVNHLKGMCVGPTHISTSPVSEAAKRR